MSQPFVGQVIRVGFNFAPAGWMTCQGQLVQISQFDTLFNLIGTTYGGDGQTNFALPDLRGRTALNMGQGANLSSYPLGQQAGTEFTTLTVPQIPAHQHLVNVAGIAGTSNTPGTSVVLANEGPQGIATVFTYAPFDSANQTNLSGQSIANAGGSQPHENRQPFLVVQYCISMFGLFPSQN